MSRPRPSWPAPAPEARIGVGLADVPASVDLVVIGLGVTGAGVALDAASRGLSVLAVDAFDLAFGTSRWSSKLVHGGLRYLAHGQLGVAHESAVERGLLMEVTAPHLTHPMPLMLPSLGSTRRRQTALTGVGFVAGDLLRRAAHTSSATLPPPRRLDVATTLSLAPGLRREGLRGGLLSHDGQLEDDARLVTTLARTAAAHGAIVRTRARALTADRTRVTLRDETTGQEREVTCEAVVNAAGVWADSLVPDVHLRPSRGTHLVFRGESFPGLCTSLTVPIPGSISRFAMVLPQPDGRVLVGLTDEPVEGGVPDVPEPSETEIQFLLDVIAPVFDHPVRREHMVGAFAGLRPLLDTHDASTADLSRTHAVLTSRNGVVTLVGGKLTTYRRMAQDGVDAAVAGSRLVAGSSRTASLPLLGAAPRETLARLHGPQRLVRRFGTEHRMVLNSAVEATCLSPEELTTAVSPEIEVTLAELVFAVSHEGARSVEDLLERRARVGLVPADADVARPMAERALSFFPHLTDTCSP